MNHPPSESSNSSSTNPVSGAAFRAALNGASRPPSWSAPYRALWWDAFGDWESAHDIAQELTTSWGAWMHAYLHRKEGDPWNARYWYRRAGMPERIGSLEGEFNDLLTALLDADGKAL